MDDCCCFCSNPPQLLLEATSNGGLHTRNNFQLLSKCDSLYQGSNPMCCQDTDSHRQTAGWQMPQIGWEQLQIHYIFSHTHWIFIAVGRNNQISGLPCLHVCLLGLKSDCIGYLKIWDMPVSAHDNSLWIISKSSVHHCLHFEVPKCKWWKFALGKT